MTIKQFFILLFSVLLTTTIAINYAWSGEGDGTTTTTTTPPQVIPGTPDRLIPGSPPTTNYFSGSDRYCISLPWSFSETVPGIDDVVIPGTAEFTIPGTSITKIMDPGKTPLPPAVIPFIPMTPDGDPAPCRVPGGCSVMPEVVVPVDATPVLQTAGVLQIVASASGIGIVCWLLFLGIPVAWRTMRTAYRGNTDIYTGMGES